MQNYKIIEYRFRLITIFAASCSYLTFMRIGLKGNQVQILNRPAAVSPQNRTVHYRKCHCSDEREGGQAGISQKTCKTTYLIKTAGIQ